MFQFVLSGYIFHHIYSDKEIAHVGIVYKVMLCSFLNDTEHADL
jgi:hypothetical protein